MLDIIRKSLIEIINSNYLAIVEIQNSMSFLDSPGTYLLWIVIGLVYIPFFSNNVYAQYANPHGYYPTPLLRRVLMGLTFIIAWLVFGFANFIRFLPN